MFRPRVIPILLLKGKGLYNSTNYKKFKYIGDPINAVRIFNELKSDELVFLDITATNLSKAIDIKFVKEIAKEANMPFSVGGGIKDIDTARKILNSGAEKVIIGTEAYNNPDFISDLVSEFGSSSVVVSVDIGKNFLGRKVVFINSGRTNTKLNPIEYSKLIENCGAGEIIINSIYNDGKMKGYDLKLIKNISSNVSIPVIASCGAGKFQDFHDAINLSYASGVAAGSFFVLHGRRRAVLISYLEEHEKKKLSFCR